MNSTYPNSDPMFSANIYTNISTSSGELEWYSSDYFVYVIGCTEQYQICNPNQRGPDGSSSHCTELGSVNGLLQESLNIGLTNYQYATSSTITLAMRSSSIFYAVQGRGSAALKAQDTVFTRIQEAKIPDNQWQIEINGWFATAMAAMQFALVEKASGPVNIIDFGGSIEAITIPGGEAICKRQMIRNVSGYQNFSTLGVVIILLVGFILVLVRLPRAYFIILSYSIISSLSGTSSC
jgi:hypothetical protein